MASPKAAVAKLLAHSQLGRNEQAIGLIWSLYPDEADFTEIVDALETAGLSIQNRHRLKGAMTSSQFVSKGRSTNSFRVNPRYMNQLNELFGPIVGAPTQIAVDDATALIPIGTLPLTRPYIKALVNEVNEGNIAQHFDSVAVILRRLVESLLIECYVHAKREADVKVNGNFVMLDRLITILEVDATITKSRNLVKGLRQVKDVGDTAAHSRNYITKKADIEHIKLESRRCLNELSDLAGL
jgi:hypothetical protein